MGVITPLDIREDLQFGFFVCAEGTSVEELDERYWYWHPTDILVTAR